MSKTRLIHQAFIILTLLAMPFLASRTEAKFTTPDCPDVKTSDFTYRKLVTIFSDTSLNEPLKLATTLREDGKVDVYFIERHGKVKRWSDGPNTVTTLIELNTWTDSKDKVDSTGPDAETGLEGIALDPDFKVNHRLYLRYEPWDKEVYRISRFQVEGDSIPLSSEKILLEVPYVREHTHLQAIVLGGAGLAFDPNGNLLIPIGANTELSPSVNEKYRDFSAEYTSSNLRSLRGAILRIHPDDSPKGYSIPKDNFSEYWSAWFKQQGKDSLASDYLDTSKVKPEIYVKGVRNPYSITVDPVRGWVSWGEFGPNRMGVTRIEEFNLATHPVNGGYPYWSGKHEFLLEGKQPWAGAGMDPKAPVNISKWNEGPKELPPADTSRYAYSALLNNGFLVGNHPVVGPLYHYDPESPSSVKFPPHFDKAWFLAERKTKSVRVLQLDETGSFVIDSTMVATTQELTRPLDLEQGADGALYVVDYGDGWHSTGAGMHIGRIEYNGNCRPGVAVSVRKFGKGNPNVYISPRLVDIREEGEHIVRQTDLSGREILNLKGSGPHVYEMSRIANNGVTLITITFSGTQKKASKLIISP
ncbi:MAG: PQQ-dependent sugar dehydrogenase [Fibrobacterota bacterium]|nr:PQQ-dependent sugar dehydrogenase [Fibrobacterota bacterium]